MYHYIGTPPAKGDPHRGLTVPPSEFESQLRSLRAMSYTTLLGPQFGEHLQSPQFKKWVWLTFDDGHVDNYEVAFPLLKKYTQRATFFVVVDYCLKGEQGFMNVAQMKEMVAEGMEIGCHTFSHPRLAKLKRDEMRREVIDSKKALEDALGVPVRSFCYPYGSHNDEVVEAVQEAGYQVATSTIRDNVNQERDRWKLRRVMIQPGRVGLKFRYSFSNFYHIVHERKNKRRWKAKA